LGGGGKCSIKDGMSPIAGDVFEHLRHHKKKGGIQVVDKSEGDSFEAFWEGKRLLPGK